MIIKKLNEEHLKKATPYMLRNDGKLINCPSLHISDDSFLKHPYFIGMADINAKKEFYEQVLNSFVQKTMLWFYKNTNHSDIKNLIRIFVKYASTKSYIKKLLKDIDLSEFKLTGKEKDIDESEFKLLFKQLERELNQEFCRIRTSDMFYGGSNKDLYCRISSVNFNWFNLIWDLVYENKNFISSVTITTDPDSGKTDDAEIYSHNGQEINHMNVDEFITLPGNPIIESFEKKSDEKLAGGCSLYESFSFSHPERICHYFDNRKIIELRKRLI